MHHNKRKVTAQSNIHEGHTKKSDRWYLFSGITTNPVLLPVSSEFYEWLQRFDNLTQNSRSVIRELGTIHSFWPNHNVIAKSDVKNSIMNPPNSIAGVAMGSSPWRTQGQPERHSSNQDKAIVSLSWLDARSAAGKGFLAPFRACLSSLITVSWINAQPFSAKTRLESLVDWQRMFLCIKCRVVRSSHAIAMSWSLFRISPLSLSLSLQLQSPVTYHAWSGRWIIDDNVGNRHTEDNNKYDRQGHLVCGSL